MNLAELMREDRILMDLSESSKEAVLRTLVYHLVDTGEVVHGDEILQLLMEREKLMTTGVRTGFAIPHAFSRYVQHPVVALGHVPDGVDWNALDGRPVNYVFLLLGQPASEGGHLRLLAHLSRLLSNQVFVHRLCEAQTPEQVLEAIRASERKSGRGGR